MLKESLLVLCLFGAIASQDNPNADNSNQNSTIENGEDTNSVVKEVAIVESAKGELGDAYVAESLTNVTNVTSENKSTDIPQVIRAEHDNSVEEGALIPLENPFSSQIKEENQKDRYIIRLKKEALKNMTSPSYKTNNGKDLLASASKELNLIFNNLSQFVNEDGNFYLKSADVDSIQKNMDLMFYDIVRDPETYAASLQTDEIASLVGGVNKTLVTLLKQQSQNTTMVQWYIDQVFQRMFGTKVLDKPLPSSVKTATNTSIIATMMNSIIDELVDLVNDTRKRLNDLPVASVSQKIDAYDIFKSVTQVKTTVTTVEENISNQVDSLSEKILENIDDMKKIMSQILELKDLTTENKAGVESLSSAIGSLSSIAKPRCDACLLQTAANTALGGIGKKIEDLNYLVLKLSENEPALNLENFKNFTSTLIVALGKFIKMELSEMKNIQNELFNNLETNVVKSMETKDSHQGSIESVLKREVSSLAFKITRTSKLLEDILKMIGELDKRVAHVDDLVNEDVKNESSEKLQKNVLALSTTLTFAMKLLTDLIKTVNDRFDQYEAQSSEYNGNLLQKTDDLKGLRELIEEQHKMESATIGGLSSLVSANNKDWKNKLDLLAKTIESIVDGNKDLMEKIKENYKNHTSSINAGFQFGTVSSAMLHQILREINTTLNYLDGNVNRFMTSTHSAYTKIAKSIADAYRPSPRNTDYPEVGKELKILEAFERKISGCKSRRSNIESRDSSNETTLEGDDIRYNYEDLIWVLKACHTNDPALCGYAWCAKVCGFDCPFDCNRYVSCFGKYKGNKELVRDCHIGVEEVFVRPITSEQSLKVDCSDALFQGREAGTNFAIFDVTGGNFYKKHTSNCNISSIDQVVKNVTDIKGYTILASSCMKCKEHLKDWNGANITRLIDYVTKNCTSDVHQCNGMTANPTGICCPVYPCNMRDKESCCDRGCLRYYRSPQNCYKPKILVSSPFVTNHDLTAGSRTILGSLFVGKSVEVSVVFPERCVIPGFQMIVAAMKELPKGSKHPGQKSLEELSLNELSGKP
ncbi:uncharacterized protein LOC136034526 [Artemia franciscana]|uniref:Uncharacterized protein n=1 Tax=Artemia franciscana TaxID=6661 RepID=A0AA88LA01_ARTSF|nr:hypothetical protein QYM36_003013 [Artemia franciscana]